MGTRKVALAIDIGGTKVEAAIVSADGELIANSRHRRPTGRGRSRDEIEHSILDAAAAALDGVTPGDTLVGVGVGAAGPVDREHDSISPLNLPRIAGLRVADVLNPIVQRIPIAVTLDGTCIALAEHWRGAAAGARHAMAMIVSTGVGGGFILNGHPVRGRTGNAGHIGQLRIQTRDPADNHFGTVEQVAAGPATVEWARKHGWHGATGEELAVSYAAGDEIARAAIRRSANAVGEAIVNAATLLDLEVAVVAGGFVNVAPDYIDLVRESVQDSSVLGYTTQVRVSPSGLDGLGPLVGAAAMVHHRYDPS